MSSTEYSFILQSTLSNASRDELKRILAKWLQSHDVDAIPDRRDTGAMHTFLSSNIAGTREDAQEALSQVFEPTVKRVCESMGLEPKGRKRELIERILAEQDLGDRGMGADERQFLAQLRQFGRRTGNSTLQRNLGWDDARYEQAKQKLLTSGAIVLGPGRGGSVLPVEGGTLSSEELEFMEALRELGGEATNPRLHEKLGWQEAKYTQARDSLLRNHKTIWIGPGRGGKVGLSGLEEEEEEEDNSAETGGAEEATGTTGTPRTGPRDQKLEADLYEPLVRSLEDSGRWIEHLWSRELDFTPPPQTQIWIEITANHTHPAAGASTDWNARLTVPDITIACIYENNAWMTPSIEIYSIEVKREADFDIRAVYEAHGHLRRSNAAFVFYHISENLAKSDKRLTNKLSPVLDVATRLGVGVITGSRPDDTKTWDLHSPPTRRIVSHFTTMSMVKFMRDNKMQIEETFDQIGARIFRRMQKVAMASQDNGDSPVNKGGAC